MGPLNRAKPPLRPIFSPPLILLIALCITTACGDESGKQGTGSKRQLEPKRDLKPPANFNGPIDPEWPPSKPAGPGQLLEESRRLREEYQKRQHRSGAPSPSIQTSPELFVERGKIGDFEYLEVIMGRMQHPDDPMPLVVVLHGRGGKPRIPAESFRSELPLRFFIPQAPDKLGDGYTWLATWTNSPDKQLFARSLAARADQLAPAIRAYQKVRPTLGKPIVTGFSQGGILSFALATRYPRQFAAAFPLAGWLPAVLYPKQKKGQSFPYIYAQHGGVDSIVPTAKGRETVRALRARGLRVDYREVEGVGHVVTTGMNNEVHQATKRYLAGYFKDKKKKPKK